MKSYKGWILLYLKGLGMGGADVVPGVSGGTIAFISGIYEELIDAIKQIDLEAVRLLFSFNFRKFWMKINGTFLLVLLAGISTSIITLARLITFLLHEHPIQLWSFFFGLIAVSALVVSSQIKQKNWQSVISVILGIAVAYAITSMSPVATDEGLTIIFFSGMLAICAMILPGVSGSFILLIFGKYDFILASLRDINMPVIITFILGCGVGILSFARIISWLLLKYHDWTIALLSGFMIGSLNKIWPWKVTTQLRSTATGEQVPFLEENILPANYLELTGNQPLILHSIFFMALGFLMIVVLEMMAKQVRNKNEK